LLPIFIYVLCRSNLQTPLRNKDLLWSLCHPDQLYGEPGNVELSHVDLKVVRAALLITASYSVMMNKPMFAHMAVLTVVSAGSLLLLLYAINFIVFRVLLDNI
jgi:hypothetical protein